jgi:hypothetical protein
MRRLVPLVLLIQPLTPIRLVVTVLLDTRVPTVNALSAAVTLSSPLQAGQRSARHVTRERPLMPATLLVCAKQDTMVSGPLVCYVLRTPGLQQARPPAMPAQPILRSTQRRTAVLVTLGTT